MVKSIAIVGLIVAAVAIGAVALISLTTSVVASNDLSYNRALAVANDKTQPSDHAARKARENWYFRT